MIEWKYADLLKQGSVKKTYVIDYPGGRITNDDLILESVEVAEAISNDKSIKFGKCISSSFKFKTKNVAINLIGQQLSVNMVANDDYAYPLPMGVYVARTEAIDTNGLAKTISCYDALYDILNTDYSEWYHQLFKSHEEMTIQQFRNAFFDFVGIQQDMDSLILDSYTIHEQNVINEKITGNTILTSLCEINGCFGRIGRTGLFEYIHLNESGYLYPAHTLYPSNKLFPGIVSNGNISSNTYITCKAENFEVQRINYISLVNENGIQIGGYGQGRANDNRYQLINNMFVYSLDNPESAAKVIYDTVSNITYQPFTSDAMGNPCLQPGDSVRIQLTDGRVINSYILRRNLKGIHALRDNIGSSGTEYIEQKNTGVASEIRQLKEATSQQAIKLETMERNELKIVWVADESQVGSDPYTFYCIAK